MSKPDFVFPELHYKTDNNCYCPNSEDRGDGRCKYCLGYNAKAKQELNKRVKKCKEKK